MKENSWHLSEVIGVGVANPPSVHCIGVPDDFTDEQLQGLFNELEAAGIFACVKHRGKLLHSRSSPRCFAVGSET